MEQTGKFLEKRWTLALIIVIGFIARMAAATLGYNFDMKSWSIVAEITRHGGDVYLETSRYNYGPPWFFILHWLDLLASLVPANRIEVLHYMIAAFLSLVDVGIFFVLCRLAGSFAAVIFYLNPVAILITGFHCQFDNLAILIGLCSVWLFGDDFENPVNRRKFYGLLVLGLSLVVKHIFFAFPLWLAVKQKGFLQKVIIVAVPVSCFLLSFAPYWPEGHEGIMDHVFRYNTHDRNYFYGFFVPPCIQSLCSSRNLFFLLMTLFAFVCRARKSLESLLIYTGVLVAFSPITVNEYFAIPVVLASVYPSTLFVVYTAICTLHLCMDSSGPHLLSFLYGDCSESAIFALCVALAWLLFKEPLQRLALWAKREVLLQFGRQQ